MLENFSIWSIFTGLVSGAIGMWMFKEGKKNSNLQVVMISIILMLYTWFTPNFKWDIVIGAALCYYARQVW